MGYVKKEGSSWYFSTDVGKDPITGKRKRKKQRGFKTKREAEKALALIEAEVYKGTYSEPSNEHLSVHLSNWYMVKKNSVGFQTAETYKGYIKNRIVPYIGHYQLSKLTASVLQNYVNELKEEGLSSATIKKIYNILKGALDHAVNMDLLPVNHITKIQLPKIIKNDLKVWDTSQLQLFLEHIKGERLYPAFYLAITTGMRKGEFLGVRWKDIDFQNGIVYVRQTLSKDGKRLIPGAKTEASIRSIKLTRECIEVLLQHKPIVENEKLSLGIEYVDEDLVNCTSKGTPINPNNFSRTFLRLIKESGLPRIRVHDLRHSHATMLIAGGVNAKVISERLGHSNIKVTLDTYSHVLPSMQEEAANRIDELLSKE